MFFLIFTPFLSFSIIFPHFYTIFTPFLHHFQSFSIIFPHFYTIFHHFFIIFIPISAIFIVKNALFLPSQVVDPLASVHVQPIAGNRGKLGGG
jgi:hypothetical protein